MSKKEINNTFSEGMIQDLNPINTPNTVLTDCLNGTIITYDGNEFSLQNDKGNYPLKNCKLKPNYMPIGVKEFGDIIYIVSYNPLNKKVQIGSYPSRETKFGENEGSIDRVIPELFYPIVNNEVLYSDILKNENIINFFNVNDPDNSKINPGDKYKVVENNLELSNLERLEYLIRDNDNLLVNISKDILKNQNTPIPTGWFIPGWLCVKRSFVKIDTLNTYASISKKINTDGSYSNSLHIKFEIRSFDKKLRDEFEKWYKSPKETRNKFLEIIFNLNSDKEQTLQIEKFQTLSNQTIYYGSIVIDEIKSDNVEIISKVAIHVKNKDTDIRVIYDDKYINTTNVTLESNVKTDLKIEDVWKYEIDTRNNDKYLNIEFETSGTYSASTPEPHLYYTFSRFNFTSKEPIYVKGYEFKELTDWSLYGSSFISDLKFDKFSESEYLSNPNKFYPEDIYLVTLYISFNENAKSVEDVKNDTKFEKVVIASELMNQYYTSVKNYEDINFNDWFSNYSNFVKVNKYSILDEQLKPEVNPKLVISDPESFNKWENYSEWPEESVNYRTFTEQIKKDSFSASAEINPELTIRTKPSVKVLTGPLWYHLLKSNSTGLKTFSSFTTIENSKPVNVNTGLCNDEISLSGKTLISNYQIYNWKNLNNSNFYLWSYNIKGLQCFDSTLLARYNPPKTGSSATNENRKLIIQHGIPKEVETQSGLYTISQEFTKSNFSETDTEFYKRFTKVVNNKKYDLGKSKLVIEIIENEMTRKDDYAKLLTNGNSILEIIGKTKGYKNKLFYSFNVSNRIVHIPADMIDADPNWKDKYEHILCNNDPKYGSFYKANKYDSRKVNKSYFINGILEFSKECMWNNTNLLEGGLTKYENYFEQNYPNLNINNLVGIPLNLKNIQVPQLNNELNIDLNNINIIINKLNNELNQFDNRINIRNNDSVIGYNDWSIDEILRNPNLYPKDSNKYLIKTGSTTTNLDNKILRLLNGEFNSTYSGLSYKFKQEYFLDNDIIEIKIGNYTNNDSI